MLSDEKKEVSKRLIIEQIKRFCELYKPKEGIGEGGLDELADKILSFSKDYISKDKIREKIDKYRKKSEKLHSQELWHEPEDSIKDFKYNHYLEAYKELLEEN